MLIYREAKLTNVDKLEMINYGLDPVSAANNHGCFYSNKVLGHIKQKDNIAVIFPGCKIESYGRKSFTTYFDRPLMINLFDENTLQLFPFALQERENKMERFVFDISDGLSSDGNNSKIRILYESKRLGFGENVEISFLNTGQNLGNEICLPNQIPVHEIHEKQIEEICNIYCLDIIDESPSGNQEDPIGIKYILEGKNKRSFSMTLYKRDKTSRIPQTIAFYLSGNTGLSSEVKKMSNWLQMFRESLDGKGNFELSGTAYQTYHLDQLIRKIIDR